MKRYYLLSLGCPKNLVDSERMAALAARGGWSSTDSPESADLLLVNTCGFIRDAKDESIDAILELAEVKKPGAKLVATGCLVQRYFNELDLPEAHLLRLKDFAGIAALFGADGPDAGRRLLTPPHTAYLRISDGCDNRCAYCAIPLIRGPLCSEPLEALVAEARTLAARGVKELIITAQDTAQYGLDTHGRSLLPDLLRRLHDIAPLRWLRLMYLHPAHIDDRLLATIAALPKVLRYLDIPLQHSEDEVLAAMGRRIDRKGIERLLARVREALPGVAIRTTMLVGHPGETPAAARALKAFVRQQRFERLGVFAYSPEDGTPAAEMQQVPRRNALRRQDALMAMQQDISQQWLAEMLGQRVEVLVERPGRDTGIVWEGRATFDAPDVDGIVLITDGEAAVGDIVEVEVTDSWEYDLIGKIVSGNSPN
ncbi:MAG: 30S ribosomal protein S12 methylthiotransferase RimO [Candidatus Cloacimonetes bacterium]|nr:30S ribosomal protein S12 methylthiotransferase RimO [Candidatus Cloacimonadota bacterium]